MIKFGMLSKISKISKNLSWLKSAKGSSSGFPIFKRNQAYYDKLAEELAHGMTAYNPRTGRKIVSDLHHTAVYREPYMPKPKGACTLERYVFAHDPVPPIIRKPTPNIPDITANITKNLLDALA